jgi:hypothetical protein
MKDERSSSSLIGRASEKMEKRKEREIRILKFETIKF